MGFILTRREVKKSKEKASYKPFLDGFIIVKCFHPFFMPSTPFSALPSCYLVIYCPTPSPFRPFHPFPRVNIPEKEEWFCSYDTNVDRLGWEDWGIK